MQEAGIFRLFDSVQNPYMLHWEYEDPFKNMLGCDVRDGGVTVFGKFSSSGKQDACEGIGAR